MVKSDDIWYQMLFLWLKIVIELLIVWQTIRVLSLIIFWYDEFRNAKNFS